METKKTFIDGVVNTINVGGSALVAAFDTGARYVNCTVTRLLPGEKSQLTAKIQEIEASIHNLYIEIGKESSRFTDPAEAFVADQVQALISKLREYETALAEALQRIEQIAQEKIAAKRTKKEARPVPEKKENIFVSALGLASARAARENVFRNGSFTNMSDKEIFERVAHYLLNDETELRILLIKDLGRAGSKAALPSLIDALRDKDSRIKIAVLAALSYIKDATAVDPIIQVLSDDNVDVRARALDSIKNITGVEADFDVHAEGEALKEWINLLKKCLETWVTTVTAAPVSFAPDTYEAVVNEANCCSMEENSVAAEPVAEEATADEEQTTVTAVDTEKEAQA